jgi:DUF2934 family protein
MNGSYPGNMSSTCPVPLIFEGTDGIARDVQRVYDRIMTKAYEHSLARGAVHGHEIDDWLWAEALLGDPPGSCVAVLCCPSSGSCHPR